MARNEEKHFGKLNRLYLLKEKEEYEKKNPKRPRLDTLVTVEEIQKWLPSIKRDIDFYLKKSQVTCYSDAHVDECREEIVKLEKEFKAFVRKIKNLSPYPVHTIPWTNRAYERKHNETTFEDQSVEFRPIPTPILDVKTGTNTQTQSSQLNDIFFPLNDQPLTFSNDVEICSCGQSFKDKNSDQPLRPLNSVSDVNNTNLSYSSPVDEILPFKSRRNVESGTLLLVSSINTSQSFDSTNNNDKLIKQCINIVDYDSSDSET